MNIFFHLLILNLCKFTVSSIVVLPFELNQINLDNQKYTSTELINLLFEKEFYSPMVLGIDGQKYFGVLSFNDHHPILSESNCEKLKRFSQNIINKKYSIEKSNSKKYLGSITDYLNTIKFVDFYNEQFWYYNETNETLIESNKNNMKNTEIFLIKDNNTHSTNQEMCLSIGLNEPFKVYSNPSPPHFIYDLYSKNKIETQDWTIKFTEKNKGQLIIGDLPHNYETDKDKYSESNYTKCNTECIITFFQPWGIEMKEIYFNNQTNDNNDKIIVNKNNNKLLLIYNFRFIIGSYIYKNLIYQNYFQKLINDDICFLEKSNITKYNKSHYFIQTDGDYFMFICKKDKMQNHLKEFPSLYFSHVKYEYIFELTYEDLFMEINDYYYFMVIFPNINPNDYDVNEKEEWHLGLPFLRKYQFVMNYDSKTIGFYKFQNIKYKNDTNNTIDKNKNNENKEDKKDYKIWIIILGVLIVLSLIISAFFIGKYISKQRRKRANELKDDDFEYVEEKFKENNENKLIND